MQAGNSIQRDEPPKTISKLKKSDIPTPLIEVTSTPGDWMKCIVLCESQLEQLTVKNFYWFTMGINAII